MSTYSSNLINYPTIADALKRVEQQKDNYQKKLLNCRFLYVYVNKNNELDCKEVVFRKSSYLHLTGLDYKHIQSQKRQGAAINGTEAVQFFERLGNDDSLLNDMSFIKGRTAEETQKYFKYTQHKLDNLSQLTQLSNKAEFIGKYTGNRAFDIIINRNMSSLALFQSHNIYLPASLLFGKPQLVATDIKPVIAIFSKKDSYFKLEYLNSKINIGKKLFSENLFSRLQIESFDNSAIKFNDAALEKLKCAFEVSVRKKYLKQADLLAKKRSIIFENDTTFSEYENEKNRFISEIANEFEAVIAINILNGQKTENLEALINDEISEITGKFRLKMEFI